MVNLVDEIYQKNWQSQTKGGHIGETIGLHLSSLKLVLGLEGTDSGLSFKSFELFSPVRFLILIDILAFASCSSNTSDTRLVILVDEVCNIANLISNLNFYKLIPYPMDNCLSGRHRLACQTPEKDVLCLHRPVGPSTVHSQGDASYFLPV